MYCICKNCKQKAEVDTSIIYTSFPPQYRYHCEYCESTGWVTLDELYSVSEDQMKLNIEKEQSLDVVNDIKKIVNQVKELNKEAEDTLRLIEKLKKEIEQLKYKNKQITYIPINIPEITTNGTNPCEYCYSNPKYRTKGIYVGDSPCQWCPHSPYKVTCSSINSTNTKETNK